MRTSIILSSLDLGFPLLDKYNEFKLKIAIWEEVFSSCSLRLKSKFTFRIISEDFLNQRKEARCINCYRIYRLTVVSIWNHPGVSPVLLCQISMVFKSPKLYGTAIKKLSRFPFSKHFRSSGVSLRGDDSPSVPWRMMNSSELVPAADW